LFLDRPSIIFWRLVLHSNSLETVSATSTATKMLAIGAIAATYQKRRDVLVKGLREAGWPVELPKASMYVWARIPETYRSLGSLEFTKQLLARAKVSVSPGIGFGDYGDGHVRFALIENENRIRQAVRGIRAMLRS
jgi:alanine-synthesizing transaminase